MKYTFYSILTFSLLFLFGCGDKSATTKKADNVSSASKTQTVKSNYSGGTPIYPSIPHELGMKIWNEGEMIDYLFHNLPFSMSQDEPKSIQTNMTYIAPELVYEIPSQCKPIARQFYQVGGDIILEADVYYSEDCYFYVFLVDGKPQYANQMTDSGKFFFDNIIKQASQARKEGAPQ